MEILFDEYGFTIDTEWLYFTINWWLIGILVAGFVGYKIYSKVSKLFWSSKTGYKIYKKYFVK